jgi:hypothetical protein
MDSNPRRAILGDFGLATFDRLAPGVEFLDCAWGPEKCSLGGTAVAGIGIFPFLSPEVKAARASAQGFRSFSTLKTALGPAGAGKHWHHIVEQTPGNVARFGPEAVHNTQNVMRLDAAVHARVSGFYSSIQPQVTGSASMTVRQWMSTQSFEAQQAFGQEVLRQFGGL